MPAWPWRWTCPCKPSGQPDACTKQWERAGGPNNQGGAQESFLEGGVSG